MLYMNVESICCGPPGSGIENEVNEASSLQVPKSPPPSVQNFWVTLLHNYMLS